MKVEKTFCNIKCDNCGEILDDEFWLPKEQEDCLGEILNGNNWIEVNGKHYCPECYSYDDNDNLVINEENRKI